MTHQGLLSSRDFVTLTDLRKCHPRFVKPLRQGWVGAGRRREAGGDGDEIPAAAPPATTPAASGAPLAAGVVLLPGRARSCGASRGAGWLAMA